jgi:NAD(P)-dependent dehydrogenase (short-subunit alcohol dehydrogenase family)
MPLSRNSVVLITASSAGLGAAAARAFAASGVRVVINYHSSREKADNLLKELPLLDPTVAVAGVDKDSIDESPRFLAIQADVSQRTELIRLVEESVAAMGRLDVVVSNQGWTRMRDFYNLDENIEESDWDKCFNMNVKSHLFLFHAAKNHLEKMNGAFITTASLAGVIPSGSSVV